MTDKGAEIVKTQEEAARQGLYLPQMEHDACGIGAVVSIEGLKTRSTVDQALKIVEKLEHRAGKDADGSTGDGVGIMTQIPHAFFSRLELGFDLPAERVAVATPALTVMPSSATRFRPLTRQAS